MRNVSDIAINRSASIGFTLCVIQILPSHNLTRSDRHTGQPLGDYIVSLHDTLYRSPMHLTDVSHLILLEAVYQIQSIYCSRALILYKN